jgi:PKD repeat protein
MMRRTGSTVQGVMLLLTLLYALPSIAATNKLPIANAGPDRTGTVGSTIVFSGSGSSDPDGIVAAYWWQFGDGGSATTNTSSVSHAYAAVGTYNLSLWVRDNAGAWSAVNDAATVTIGSGTTTPTTTTTTTTKPTGTTLANRAPVANAGPNQATQTLLTLTFNGSGSSDPDGSIASASWNFGDGATASGLTTTHPYARAGTYTATLAVVDNRGASASDTATVTVANRAPYAKAGPDVSGQPGTAVTLNGSASGDPDGTLSSYAWTFGDGATGTGAIVNHAYGTAGTYTASLTVTDNNGARGTDTAVATVGGASSTWSRRLGAAGSDAGYAVAGDASGNTFVGGNFYATADFGGTTLTSAGGSDWFLAKYGPTGSLLWAKRMGGTSEDLLDALAVGPDGDVVATGRFSGSSSFGGTTLVANGTNDMVVAKYSGTNGAHQWSKRFGGAYDDAASAVAIDGSNNVFFTGYFRGTADFGGGPLSVPYVSDLDVFVVKLSSVGTHVWSKHFANTGNERGYGIATDAGGNVVIAGAFSNGVDFGGGTLTSGNGMTDVFVARFTGSGVHTWSRRFGATDGSDGAYGVAVDGSGNVVVVGYAVKAVDFGGGLLSALGSSDVFVAKYSGASGTHMWSRRLGGTGNDYGYGVAVDGAGNVIVVGAIGGVANFGGVSLTPLGGSDGFVAKYGPTGNLLWAKRMGGISDDIVRTIGVSAGSPVATGYFYGTGDFNGTTLNSAGMADAFVVRVAP